MRPGEIKQHGKPGHLSPVEHLARPANDSRALVPLAPPATSHEAGSMYREAAFIAQLIACKDQHPQMRERRRATPDEAIAAYCAAARFSRQDQ